MPRNRLADPVWRAFIAGLHATMTVATAAAGVGALLALFAWRGEGAGSPVGLGQ